MSKKAVKTPVPVSVHFLEIDVSDLTIGDFILFTYANANKGPTFRAGVVTTTGLDKFTIKDESVQGFRNFSHQFVVELRKQTLRVEKFEENTGATSAGKLRDAVDSVVENYLSLHGLEIVQAEEYAT